MLMKNKFCLGILSFFLLIGSTVFGMFSENSRQGSEPIFSISGQGVELLNPAPDLGSEGTGAKTNFGVNNLAKTMTPYLYTGRRYSTVTELYFNRNRYYSPKVGRFISKDPIGFEGGLNLWGYGKNNPPRFKDPFGQTVEKAINFLEDAGKAAGVEGAIYQEWAMKLAPYTPPSQDDIYGLSIVSDTVRRIYEILPMVNNPCAREALKNAIREIMCGQSHHAISKKVYRAGLKHYKGLSSSFSERDSGYIAKAIENAHVGYASWHRELDSSVVDYTNEKGNDLSPQQFINYLMSRYGMPDLRARFPFGFTNLEYWIRNSNPDNDDESGQ
ncbi:MAG: RHS repeat-associated core domain-containing protein [Candidatus Riflebacteria bacterium]|nr:RHS repeat-associated core domain-containing protein [Candidatus Riflebacteria bacterium]